MNIATERHIHIEHTESKEDHNQARAENDPDEVIARFGIRRASYSILFLEHAIPSSLIL